MKCHPNPTGATSSRPSMSSLMKTWTQQTHPSTTRSTYPHPEKRLINHRRAPDAQVCTPDGTHDARRDTRSCSPPPKPERGKQAHRGSCFETEVPRGKNGFERTKRLCEGVMHVSLQCPDCLEEMCARTSFSDLISLEAVMFAFVSRAMSLRQVMLTGIFFSHTNTRGTQTSKSPSNYLRPSELGLASWTNTGSERLLRNTSSTSKASQDPRPA